MKQVTILILLFLATNYVNGSEELKVELTQKKQKEIAQTEIAQTEIATNQNNCPSPEKIAKRFLMFINLVVPPFMKFDQACVMANLGFAFRWRGEKGMANILLNILIAVVNVTLYLFYGSANEQTFGEMVNALGVNHEANYQKLAIFAVPAIMELSRCLTARCRGLSCPRKNLVDLNRAEDQKCAVTTLKIMTVAPFVLANEILPLFYEKQIFENYGEMTTGSDDNLPFGEAFTKITAYEVLGVISLGQYLTSPKHQFDLFAIWLMLITLFLFPIFQNMNVSSMEDFETSFLETFNFSVPSKADLKIFGILVGIKVLYYFIGRVVYKSEYCMEKPPKTEVRMNLFDYVRSDMDDSAINKTK